MEAPPEAGQLEQAHRQSGWMLVFTLSLVLFLLYSLAARMAGGAELFTISSLLSIPFCVLLVRAYFRRESWALPWVTTVWILAMVLCFLLALFEFSEAASGQNLALVQGGLLLFLCWSMLNRLRFLRHPYYRAWYDGSISAVQTDIALDAGEILACCPHCQSLLAVRPLDLKPIDECPHCMQRLVTAATAARFLEEE